MWCPEYSGKYVGSSDYIVLCNFRKVNENPIAFYIPEHVPIKRCANVAFKSDVFEHQMRLFTDHRSHFIGFGVSQIIVTVIAVREQVQIGEILRVMTFRLEETVTPEKVKLR